MKRSQLREHLFCMLFRSGFYEKEELDEQIAFYFEALVKRDYKAPAIVAGENGQDEIDEFFGRLNKPNQKEREELTVKFKNIVDKMEELDERIAANSEGWSLNRIGKADLTILRLATYEIIFDEDVPTGVAIDEAVELAKRFAGDKGPSFINGVLSKIAG